ncbi:MarR family transcriptional regulator [Flagellatimonas centrodinii]|uniref:MarR family winged helix-turn-helix transcriptional regulator n=1 Tax=Flagellatimonas centrodinii TaxID=2806210 RepID=UPI001FF060A3|nr:MarR family transcriptional regulator [Flagellatimonas centrodinii]ULQ45300.1 MarR family transcriptional regulator [Flagellatimonas centrodinii]
MPRPTKRQYEVIGEFRYQLRRFLAESERLAKAAGVTPLQYQLLLQTQARPGRDWASVRELAESLQSSPHGTVALIDRCVALGLVERRRHPDDARRVEVHPTPGGRRLLQQLAAAHLEQLVALQGRFAVPDRAALRAAP